MTTMIVYGVVFAVLGAIVPWASSALLQWRRKSYEQWFETSASDAATFRRDHGRAPSSKARGHEGALGIWEESLRRMAGDRALSRGQALRAIEAVGDTAFSDGFDLCSLPSDSSMREEFSLAVSPKVVVPCAAALAAAGIGSAFVGMGPLASTLYAAIAAVCAAITLCDIRCRTIPFVLPAVLAVLGAAFWMLVAGWDGLIGAGIVALVAAVLLLVVSIVGKVLRGYMPMGIGDLVTMPAVALCAGWPGFVYGLVVGFVCGLIALVVARIVRGGPPAEKRVPLGPVLSLCAATGVFFSFEAITSLFA